MPVEEAKYHMKRCVDSGLWVPNAGDAEVGESEKSLYISNLENEAEVFKSKSESVDDKVAKTVDEPIYTGVSTNDLD